MDCFGKYLRQRSKKLENYCIKENEIVDSDDKMSLIFNKSLSSIVSDLSIGPVSVGTPIGQFSKY